jgi:hypothetical protein
MLHLIRPQAATFPSRGRLKDGNDNVIGYTEEDEI